jgi:hypothetical protein
MRFIVTSVILLLASACSQDAEDPNQQNDAANQVAETDLAAFVGKPFSALVRADPAFQISQRAVNPEAVSAFADADGIEVPGELHRFRSRELLVFFTCRQDQCSQAANIIVIDTNTRDLHVVNEDEGQTTVVVDGPPDIAKLVRTSCDISSCNWKTEAPVENGAFQDEASPTAPATDQDEVPTGNAAD